jgi:hypothetical protein
VTEQIVRRTVEGESISYKVNVPGQNQVMSLTDLGSSHHASVDDVKQELLSNAEKMINSMAEKAKAMADEFFETSDTNSEILLPAMAAAASAPGDPVKIDLGDGLIANIDLSGIGGPK